jgi:hypothetical protein
MLADGNLKQRGSWQITDLRAGNWHKKSKISLLAASGLKS